MRSGVHERVKRIVEIDPYLKPYGKILEQRLSNVIDRYQQLTRGEISIADFAAGHEYFGLHYRGNGWVFREWAPNATSVYLIGDMTGWQETDVFRLDRINEEGVWELSVPARMMNHGDLYRLRIHWKEGVGDRIPAYARRVLQDSETLIFNAQVWLSPQPYEWKCLDFICQSSALFIYEAHVGMAQEEEKIGSYREFMINVLPRIVDAGYNTLQLMAIQEHPYYGSFGYQVSSFFAASSRFGTPEDLKELIDTAHVMGLNVIMDIIHSHAASNEVEGLSRFDGTLYQYFHEGPRGFHQAWDSRCFNYGKYQVLHFLLSNCRFWLDEYHFDGFRFDGVTSMLYTHHGLGKVFTSYDQYFDNTVDDDALTYLSLANTLIHDVRPDAITVAEDVSGMPSLAVPVSDGGNGFDFRFAMGVPDYWIKLTKDIPDDDWPLGHLWFELNNRRRKEKSISYAESHDQALVGDQTLIFRLIGSAMYDHMMRNDENIKVDRGIALHKIIRLITLATAGNGYLNFMGNEFGHPEWIDFPREGNAWSYRYARRQWSLGDDTGLKYHFLKRFDRDMIAMAQECSLIALSEPRLLHERSDNKVIAFERAGLVFVFNFHHSHSYSDYLVEAPPGKYQMILDSDDLKYGGHGRLQSNQYHFTIHDTSYNKPRHFISLYIPTRTVLVLKAE